MNKVRCINLHWFDAERHSVCPHCGAQIIPERNEKEQEKVSVSIGAAKEEKAKKKGLFWSKNKEQDIKNTVGSNGSIAVTGSVEEVCDSFSLQSEQRGAETEDNRETGEEHPLPQTEVLFKPVMQVSQNRHTEEPKVHTRDIDSIKTVSLYANEQGDEPVTGWLVGIKGVYKGCSFPLRTGVNVIGRDVSAYVCLKKDTQVSREKHASVIYEPKKKVFYLGEGESSMTYCNEELLCGKTELKAYDLIEIGGGNYLFIPFCGERFDWDEAE